MTRTDLRVQVDRGTDPDQLAVAWWFTDGRSAAVSLTVGTDPSALTRATPTLTDVVGGSATVPRLGLRTYVRVTPHDRPEAGVTAGERVVALDGIANVRDLGGYPTADGNTIAWGVLYRGDALTAAPSTDDERPRVAIGVTNRTEPERLRELGLRTVVDMRGEHEIRRAASVWPDVVGAGAINIPVPDGPEGNPRLAERLPLGEIRSFTLDDLIRSYRDMIDEFATAFGEVVRALARADSLPALVHCAGGKDRTGLLVAVLLSALGVPKPIIVGDYCLTEVCRPNRVEANRAMLLRAGLLPDHVEVLFESPPQAISATLAHVTERHTSAERYLLDQAGVSRAEWDRLRAALLTDQATATVPTPAGSRR